MKKQNKNTVRFDELDIVREEFLLPEELFLVGFLNSFDRISNRKWQEKGLWN